METQFCWDQGYRVFISHDSAVKEEVAKLKGDLESYGISAFVAHEDIDPTEEWQEVIKEALCTMDALVALLTKGFPSSKWTDQEVGYALCRNIPIIPVRLGIDPYGFIGKFQGLSSGWEEAPLEIVKLLIRKDPKMVDAYIKAVVQCVCFEEGNCLANVFESLPNLKNKQVKELVEAYNENSQINGSFGFNGKKPRIYGDGLLAHLPRLNKNYHYKKNNGKITLESLPV